jgi:ATP phosphoribosyltransferase regulatory subunit
MTQAGFVPQIPYGTRDFLPKEAQRKRDTENALAELFAGWGYDEVVTPTIELLETLTTGGGSDMQQYMFKFFDKSNRILAMRTDMTTPIARMAATRLRQETLPLKLFYLANVFRYEQAQAGRQCEFYQGGVELLGVPGPTADAEVIALAVESMRKAGLKDFQINLGQVEFINGIMEDSGLHQVLRQQIKMAMVSRDLVGLRELLEHNGIGSGLCRILNRIPLLHGEACILREAYQLVRDEVSKQALDNLNEIYQLLVSYGVAQYVHFDLGIIRDFDYYTGMVIEGYTPGLGFPVCAGGRYDRLLASFGADCPATGFALGIERILLALERQGLALSEGGKDVYIAWTQGNLGEAIRQAASLRKSGKKVEVALQAETATAAEISSAGKGYKKLLYLKD